MGDEQQKADDALHIRLTELASERNEIVKYFRFAHLPDYLKKFSRPWATLAAEVCETINASAERTVALRKLLEGKDAAVRAAL